MILCRLLTYLSGCLVLCTFAQAALQAPVTNLEPIPEQAFSSASSRSVPIAESLVEPSVTGQSAATEQESQPVSSEETALSQSLNAGPAPTPFYQQWLDRLFDLVAPGDPYTRDKLAFTIGTSVGYDNNVLYSATNRIESATYGAHGALDYKFGSRRLQIDAKLNGSINYYENRPGGSNDQNYGLLLAVNYELMPRLAFSFDTNSSYLSQPSPQLVGGIFAYTGSYFYTDSTVSLNYQYRPRLSFTASYELNEFKYDDATVDLNSGFYQQNFSLTANWLFSPRTTLLLQYRFNPIVYNIQGSGSQGHLLLVGVTESLTPRLNLSLSGGAEYRTLESPNADPSSYLGPFVEGTLIYNFTPNSTLNGSMRYGTEPSGSGSVRQTFRAGLGVSHKVGYALTFSGGVSVEDSSYTQIGGGSVVTQDVYNASVSVGYQIALATSIVLSDGYLVVTGSVPDTSYNRNYISLGVDVTF